MTLGATLYVCNSVEAAQTYCDAFNMTIGYNVKNEDGTYLHAEIERTGQCGFAVSESGDLETRASMITARQPTMSLGLSLDSNAQLEHAFEVLSAGGHVLRELGPLPWTPLSADLVDRYGVCWYLYVSQHRPEEM